MNKLTKEKHGHTYTIKFGDIVLGWARPEVDGYYYWWDNRELMGCTAAWTLRAIADILDEINKPWDDQINEYFETEKAREGGNVQGDTEIGT